MIIHQGVSIAKFSDSNAEARGNYRFFQNSKVSLEKIAQGITSHCEASIEEKHYLVIQDTTEANFKNHAGRIKEGSGLGVVGNNEDIGFFLHPSLVIEADQKRCIGFADIHYWTRSSEKQDKHERKYKQLPIEAKESFRWIKRAQIAQEKLKAASKITIIQDREGDIYEVFSRVPNEKVDLIVRSKNDRRIVDSDKSLFQLLDSLPCAGEFTLDVKPDVRNGRTGRKALMELSFCKVKLQPPVRFKGKEPPLEVYVVQAREKEETVPEREDPICWKILTTHKVGTLEEAMQILIWYGERWYIETLFRLWKSEGFNIEDSELERGESLIKLGFLGLWTILKVMALYLSLKGFERSFEIGALFSKEEVHCMKLVLPRINGKTKKLQNPYSTGTLQWAAWIIARLGGWKGYRSQRPPGVITMHHGLCQFEQMFVGYILARIEARDLLE